MKALFCLLIVFTLCSKAGAQKIKDSSGIYVTKQDFYNNELCCATPHRIKVKYGFLRSDFGYETSGSVFLKQADKKWLRFEPGSIYGFISEGKKFLYVPGSKKYLFVLNTQPVTILVQEDLSYGYRITHTSLSLFYINDKDTLKQLNDENLFKDFSGESDTFKALIDIENRFKEMERKGHIKASDFSGYIRQKFS